MKKLFALFLALCLGLCTMTALAESDIPVMEVPITFEGSYLAIADTGLAIALPNTWVVLEEPTEGAIATILNDADAPTLGLTIALFEEDILDLQAEFAEAVNTSGVGTLAIATLNNATLLLYAPDDGSLTDAAFLSIGDGLSLCFSFTASTEEAYNDEYNTNLVKEILGSLAYIQE